MLIEIFRGLWYLLFTARIKRSMDALLVLATWILTIFLLGVSIPHSIEVIFLYEKGDPTIRELKAIASATAIELAAGLLFLIALHTRDLSASQRKLLMVLAVPFIALTLRIQFSYYAGVKEWPIFPIELALILPYGVVTCAIAMSLLWPLVSHTSSENVTEPVATENTDKSANTKWEEYTQQWQSYAARLQAAAEQARQELTAEREGRIAERAALVAEYENRLDAKTAELQTLKARLDSRLQAQAMEKAPFLLVDKFNEEPSQLEASDSNVVPFPSVKEKPVSMEVSTTSGIIEQHVEQEALSLQLIHAPSLNATTSTTIETSDPPGSSWNPEQLSILNRAEAATKAQIMEAFQLPNTLTFGKWTALEITILDSNLSLLDKARLLYNNTSHHRVRKEQAELAERRSETAAADGGNLSEATQVVRS
jgi:hypothetical protein